MPDAPPRPEPFTPRTAPAALEDLRARLRATRWPDMPEDAEGDHPQGRAFRCGLARLGAQAGDSASACDAMTVGGTRYGMTKTVLCQVIGIVLLVP